MAKPSPSAPDHLLAYCDRERERLIEGLHAVVGNHGTTAQEIAPLLEGLADALHAGCAAEAIQGRGEPLDRPHALALKRLPKVTAALVALVDLAGLSGEL